MVDLSGVKTIQNETTLPYTIDVTCPECRKFAEKNLAMVKYFMVVPAIRIALMLFGQNQRFLTVQDVVIH